MVSRKAARFAKVTYMPKILRHLIFMLLAASISAYAANPLFVTVKGYNLYLNDKPYYFVGANYWYGSLLGLEKDEKRGLARLRHELDLLKANGVTNLRLMAGAEGSGLLNGVTRVGPPLQPEQGKFDEHVLDGLDLVLDEMGKRDMKAVIFLSNNWEWSGGFQQYLIWNHVIADRWLTEKPSWDQLRDNVAKFYTCTPCKAAYNAQVALVLGHKNGYNKRPYIEDPTIMAWELANEPRPMRPAAFGDYSRWISDSAAMIKVRDHNHLVTIGHEGSIVKDVDDLYVKINSDKNLDYLTIHIWPKNWGWFKSGNMGADFDNVIDQTEIYAAENTTVAGYLKKPMVIEEFGLPRDGESLDPISSTTYRDRFYSKLLGYIGNQPGGVKEIAGANFWAFGGTARPKPGQVFWKKGDDLMGDPPMEEQGLNSVFDSDTSTWNTIRSFSKAIAKKPYPE